MNFYEFGVEHEDTIVMIHGLSMIWDMFKEAIDILKEYYHLIVAAVPGHDPETREEFTTVAG